MSQIFWEKFQCDVAVESGVLGFINDTHSASANLLDNFVMGERLSDEWLLPVRHVAHILSCPFEVSQIRGCRIFANCPLIDV